MLPLQQLQERQHHHHHHQPPRRPPQRPQAKGPLHSNLAPTVLAVQVQLQQGLQHRRQLPPRHLLPLQTWSWLMPLQHLSRRRRWCHSHSSSLAGRQGPHNRRRQMPRPPCLESAAGPHQVQLEQHPSMGPQLLRGHLQAPGGLLWRLLPLGCWACRQRQRRRKQQLRLLQQT